MAASQLHVQLMNGDQSAFAEVFTTLNPSMLRIALSITGNRASAEEIAQEAWLSVIENLDKYRGDAPLRHWILRILSNKALTRATRDGKTRNFASPESNGPEKFTETGDWAVAPSLWEEVTPERILAGRQTWELVQEAIEALPNSQQAILSLLENEKMSSAECADVLGMTAANVRVQLHRAREKIRQVLDAELKNRNKM